MNIKKIIAGTLIAAAAVFASPAVCDTPGFCIVSEAADTSIKSAIKYAKGCSYLTLTPSNKKNKLYFTTDGSEPTTRSRQYTSKLKFTVSKALNVIEVNSKGKTVNSIKLKILIRLEPPEIKVVNRFDGTAVISMHSDDSNAEIYYSFGDSDIEHLYEGSFSMSADKRTVIHAYCSKKNMKDSKKSDVNLYDETYYQSLEYIYKALAETNKIREQYGLTLLSLDTQLCETSYRRAKELANDYDILHYRPNGKKWYTTLTEIGYSFSFAAENIERLLDKGINPEKAVQNWMESQVHRENMLSDKCDLVGFSFIMVGENCIWVQHLAKKL